MAVASTSLRPVRQRRERRALARRRAGRRAAAAARRPGGSRGREPRRGAGDLAPGRAGRPARRPRSRRARAGPARPPPPRAAPAAPPDQGRSSQRVSTGIGAALRRSGSARRRSAPRPAPRRASPTSPAAAGRAAARRGPRSASARPEVGLQAALVELVEDHAADAGQLRVRLEHPGEDALGDHLDARARRPPRRGCGSRRVPPTGSPRPSARRSAAARAATRRGSSIRMRPGDQAGLAGDRAAPAWSCRRRAGPGARRGRPGAAPDRARAGSARSAGRHGRGSAAPRDHRPAEAGRRLDPLELRQPVGGAAEHHAERKLGLLGHGCAPRPRPGCRCLRR